MENVWQWMLSGTCSLVVIFGGFVVNRIVREIDGQRDKIAELFAVTTELRVSDEKSKVENGKEFVTKDDFSNFKDEIFCRFDKTDEKLDMLFSEMRKTEHRERNR